MPVRIDVPKEIAACVSAVGGKLLDDDHGANNQSKADYWFPESDVIGELKCLSEDYFDDLNYNDWLSKKYHEWVRRRLARPVRAGAVINLVNLPKVCSDEVTSFLRKRLDGSLKIANSQIKSSRKNLGSDSTLGLLILVNDGNRALTPGMVRNILSRSLPTKFSAINTVIHLSANMRTDAPGIDRDLFFWLEFSVHSVRPPVSNALLDQLRTTWLQHHQELLGEDIPVLNASADAVYDLKFVRD